MSKTQKKTSQKNWIFIIAAVFVFAVSAFYIQGQRAKASAETYLNTLFDLPVYIHSAQLSRISNTAKFKGIVIKNPIGFTDTQMIYIDEIRITADNLSGNPTPIKKIVVSGIDFHAEVNDSRDVNLSIFYDRLMGGLDTSVDFDISIKPGNLSALNAKLHSDGQSVTLKNKNPISAKAETETLAAHELMQLAFRAYGIEMFKAIARIKVQKGINTTKQATEGLVNDLKVLSENLEGSASDFLNFNQ